VTKFSDRGNEIFFHTKGRFSLNQWKDFHLPVTDCGPQNYISFSKAIEWENIFCSPDVHWQDGENLSSLSYSDINTSSPETNYSSVTP
jgi:hypothetical protein